MDNIFGCEGGLDRGFHPVFEVDGIRYGEIEPDYLPEETLAQVEGLYFSAFGRKETEAGIRDLHYHMRGCPVGLGIMGEGIVTAFFAYDQYQTGLGSFFHLHGILVSPDYQQQGLGTELLRRNLDRFGSDFLCFHTRNKGMFLLGKKMGDVVGDVDLKLATATMMGSNPEMLVVGEEVVIETGRYGGGLYGADGVYTPIPYLAESPGDAEVCVFKL